MSLLVVMNGPVASAGSIPNLSRIKGIDVPIPQVNSIIRDMEDDVNQLLADCAGMVEEI